MLLHSLLLPIVHRQRILISSSSSTPSSFRKPALFPPPPSPFLAFLWSLITERDRQHLPAVTSLPLNSIMKWQEQLCYWYSALHFIKFPGCYNIWCPQPHVMFCASYFSLYMCKCVLSWRQHIVITRDAIGYGMKRKSIPCLCWKINLHNFKACLALFVVCKTPWKLKSWSSHMVYVFRFLIVFIWPQISR